MGQFGLSGRYTMAPRFGQSILLRLQVESVTHFLLNCSFFETKFSLSLEKFKTSNHIVLTS